MSVEKLMLRLEEEYKSTQYLVEEKLPKELAARKSSCNNLQVQDSIGEHSGIYRNRVNL